MPSMPTTSHARDIPSSAHLRGPRSGTVPLNCAFAAAICNPLAPTDEFDFSDVFGPIATHAELNHKHVEAPPDSISAGDPQTCTYRSHSLVGPAAPPAPRLSPATTEDARVGTDGDDTGGGGRKVLVVAVEAVAVGSDSSEDSSGDEGVSAAPLPTLANGAAVECRGPEKSRLGPGDFEKLRVVGQGAFGKVYQVRKRDSGEIFAMKVMRKDRILERNHGDYMKAEKDILTKVVHPFIVQLRYAFQSTSKLFLLLDFINGGHLFFQLYRHGTFGEELARLYTAELVLAVSHLHQLGIIHRDLKPENILVDSEGHLKLTDFGLAKEVTPTGSSNSMCGTVEYMAPEIILAKGHNRSADWWSIGILLYEMLTGRVPFENQNRMKLQQKIVKERIKFPPYLTAEAHSLLKGLLTKDVAKRLGSGPAGSEEIKRHKWFKGINWAKLEAREVQPSFRPLVNGKSCIANFDEMWTTQSVIDSAGCTPVGTPTGDCHLAFKGYTYVAQHTLMSRFSGDDAGGGEGGEDEEEEEEAVEEEEVEDDESGSYLGLTADEQNEALR